MYTLHIQSYINIQERKNVFLLRENPARKSFACLAPQYIAISRTGLNVLASPLNVASGSGYCILCQKINFWKYQKSKVKKLYFIQVV
jgi:hypothetical protein